MRVALVGKVTEEIKNKLNRDGAGIEEVLEDFSEAVSYVSSGTYDKIVLVASKGIPWIAKPDSFGQLCSSRNKDTKIILFAHQSMEVLVTPSQWVEIITLESSLGYQVLLEACKSPNPRSERVEPIEHVLELSMEVKEDHTETLARPAVKILGVVGLNDKTGVSFLTSNMVLALSDRGVPVQYATLDPSLVPKVRNISMHTQTKNHYGIYNNSFWKVETGYSEVERSLYTKNVIVDLHKESLEDAKIDELVIVVDCKQLTEQETESLAEIGKYRIIWNKMNSYLMGRLSHLVKEQDIVFGEISSELISKSDWENEFLYNLIECPATVRKEFSNLSKELVGV